MKLDIDLINEVKEKNSSEALSELTNRNTGLYLNIVKRYSEYSSNKSLFQDVDNEKYYNIYNWTLKYDPSKNMKFSTYIGEMTKFMCKSLLTSEKKKPIFEDIEALYDYSNSDSPRVDCESHDTQEGIEKKISQLSSDERFTKIYKLRQEKKTWPMIGKELGMSHEWARQLYKQKINQYKSCQMLK